MPNESIQTFLILLSIGVVGFVLFKCRNIFTGEKLGKFYNQHINPKPRPGVQCLNCNRFVLKDQNCCNNPMHVIDQDVIEY